MEEAQQSADDKWGNHTKCLLTDKKEVNTVTYVMNPTINFSLTHKEQQSEFSKYFSWIFNL